jgi:hypothetical protein
MNEKELVAERFMKARMSGLDACEKVWERAKEDMVFASNRENQWSKGDREALEASNRPALSISKIPNLIRTLSGRQIMDRFERQYMPRRREHRAFAQGMTNVDRAFMERAEAKVAESSAFATMATTGVGWSRMRFDTLEDPRGIILVDECPIFSMVWPSNVSMKHNLVDRAWHIYGEYWHLDDVAAVFGIQVGDIPVTLSWFGESRSAESTAGWQPASSAGRNMPGDNTTWVELMEWWAPETKHLVSVPADPTIAWEQNTNFQQVELFSEDLDGFYASLEQQGIILPPVATAEIRRKVFRYAYVIRDVVLETGPIPYNAFTFEAMTGHRVYTPQDEWRFEGIVEILKDRQRLENMFWSSLVYQWMCDPKGVLLYEKGAFEDPNAALAAWASPNAVIELTRGSLQQGRKPYEVESGQRSPSAQVAEGLMDRVSNSVVEGSGLNPALMGNLGPDLRRISGQVVRALQDAALMTNAQLYDSLSLYRRRTGALFLRMLSEHYSEQDVAELVGEELVTDQSGQLMIPPKEMWREDAWRSISVQEAVPSPDAMRATWEGLVESGGLQALLQSGSIDAGVIAEIVPDLPENVRTMIRDRAAMMQQQMAAMQQQGGVPPQQ